MTNHPKFLGESVQAIQPKYSKQYVRIEWHDFPTGPRACTTTRGFELATIVYHALVCVDRVTVAAPFWCRYLCAGEEMSRRQGQCAGKWVRVQHIIRELGVGGYLHAPMTIHSRRTYVDYP